MMGGQGGHIRYHDRMLWSKTTIGQKRYKNAIFLNLKEVRRFYSIWNISFISVVMVLCFYLWLWNPETSLSRVETNGIPKHQGVCGLPDENGVTTCDEYSNIQCWDNKHIESVVMTPAGVYPTEAIALS